MPVGLSVRRAQVYLGCRDVRVPELLPQRLDVDALLVPSRGVKHPEGVARLSGLLDRVACPIGLVDKGMDDSIQVLVHRSGYGRGEDESIFRRITAKPLEASDESAAFARKSYCACGSFKSRC
jgi:hypothetical protein